MKNLIEDINKSSLSPNEKILANIEAYNKAVEAGVKTDIQVISSTNCIDSIIGKVKWPEAEGYVVDWMGNAIKKKYPLKLVTLWIVMVVYMEHKHHHLMVRRDIHFLNVLYHILRIRMFIISMK
ncbi:hypothetical protein [Bacillus mycoides]|uniref:hypothetical protein n=1 Tax=Bacillus mycoides TaxID=1405 RepID=UPI00207AA193|nr:hypothetical protein [Bacillus mycoides]